MIEATRSTPPLVGDISEAKKKAILFIIFKHSNWADNDIPKAHNQLKK